MRAYFTPLIALALIACDDEQAAEAPEPVIRGLKTFEVADVEETTVRRFPSVLQPAAISSLSFEVGGKLTEVDLTVGQRVEAGEVLATLDPTSLEIAVAQSQAALEQSEARANNDAEEAERQAELLRRGVATKAAADKAQADAEASAAQVVQSARALDTAKDNLTKTTLAAPFDGILNSVEVESFTNVSPGAPVATLYSVDAFEVSFAVSFEVSSQLTVGKPVQIRLADAPDIVLSGVVSELGARADTVSSFPVIARLEQSSPVVKAGMAVEISIEFAVPTGEGFTLPLTVLPMTGELIPGRTPSEPGETQVFVYDAETETVKTRRIKIGGVRENALLVIDGLEVGERVAAAGVSFLRDGQQVKLLDSGN